MKNLTTITLQTIMHFKLLEVENQGLLDHGGIGAYTNLYYRELISRFGHHLAMNWNMCEDNVDWVKKYSLCFSNLKLLI